MKIKPYKETHMDGVVEIVINDEVALAEIVDLGIQIAEDGRVWMCIDGKSFLRFKPTNKYFTVGNKLNPTQPNAFMPIHKNKNPFE